MVLSFLESSLCRCVHSKAAFLTDPCKMEVDPLAPDVEPRGRGRPLGSKDVTKRKPRVGPAAQAREIENLNQEALFALKMVLTYHYCDGNVPEAIVSLAEQVLKKSGQWFPDPKKVRQ